MPTLARLLTALLRRHPPACEPRTDAELLTRFAAQRDSAAFELLVWRHGATVLGTCRRILRHEQTAEDAFQATFLILARKAAAVRGHLAGWLHTTARRVCLRLRKRNAFALLDAEPTAPAPVPTGDAELAAILDAEIARLPEKFRLAVVLCYLRGLTAEQAATELGIPRGTVLSRLATARKRLADRLTAKGVTVPATFLAAALATPELAAEVGTRVAACAWVFVTSGGPATVPSQLATEVLSMTTRKAVLAVATAMVLVAGVGTGVGWVLADGDKPAAQPAPAAKAADPVKADPPKPEEAVNRDQERLEDQSKRLRDMIRESEKRLFDLQAEARDHAAKGGSPAEQKANEELLTEIAKQAFAAEVALAEAKFEAEEAKPRAEEEVKRTAAAVRVKQGKLDFLHARQKDLVERLRTRPASKLLDAELDTRLTLLHALKNHLFEVQLQQQGIARPNSRSDDKLDHVLKELSELRQEVKKLQEGKK